MNSQCANIRFSIEAEKNDVLLFQNLKNRGKMTNFLLLFFYQIYVTMVPTNKTVNNKKKFKKILIHLHTKARTHILVC